MADDKTKTRPQDAIRVNVHEDYELEYWSKHFGCTREQLKAAVKKVGVMAKAVEAELKRRWTVCMSDMWLEAATSGLLGQAWIAGSGPDDADRFGVLAAIASMSFVLLLMLAAPSAGSVFGSASVGPVTARQSRRPIGRAFPALLELEPLARMIPANSCRRQ
jgi:hypothetical protein